MSKKYVLMRVLVESESTDSTLRIQRLLQIFLGEGLVVEGSEVEFLSCVEADQSLDCGLAGKAIAIPIGPEYRLVGGREGGCFSGEYASNISIAKDGVSSEVMRFSLQRNTNPVHSVTACIGRGAETLSSITEAFDKKVFNVSVKGYWKDSDERRSIDGYICAVGRQSDSKEDEEDDEDIFFYVDSLENVVGDHGEFVITSYEL